MVVNLTEQDVIEFKSTLKRNNKVFSLWKLMIDKMPPELQNEVRSKPSDLEEAASLSNEYQKTYKFVTRGASEKLTKYLDGYLIVVANEI